MQKSVMNNRISKTIIALLLCFVIVAFFLNLPVLLHMFHSHNHGPGYDHDLISSCATCIYLKTIVTAVAVLCGSLLYIRLLSFAPVRHTASPKLSLQTPIILKNRMNH